MQYFIIITSYLPLAISWIWRCSPTAPVWDRHKLPRTLPMSVCVKCRSSINAKSRRRNWKPLFVRRSISTINFNCHVIGVTQNAQRQTVRNGICMKIICCQKVISVTADRVALLTTISATRILRCFRISSLVASGKLCISWMGWQRTSRIFSQIRCMAIPKRKAHRFMAWLFYWVSNWCPFYQGCDRLGFDRLSFSGHAARNLIA